MGGGGGAALELLCIWMAPLLVTPETIEADAFPLPAAELEAAPEAEAALKAEARAAN